MILIPLLPFDDLSAAHLRASERTSVGEVDGLVGDLLRCALGIDSSHKEINYTSYNLGARDDYGSYFYCNQPGRVHRSR